ncbi:MAG: hypothetical protein WHU94_13520 [Thermogemmata sp.]|uniref:Uncharacterized protein n=1 Tax=Thermogemmata fonticola TaxID=2755323 RepID=A0A7V8VF05_9BACT|nr:hypothetical protein [Thermogemmata fonticola]MBA2226756.1 hypothetical protein [Thermogemmata fonticola]MCX8139101.1 hypothetical protein [Gemmataceae bacterium]
MSYGNADSLPPVCYRPPLASHSAGPPLFSARRPPAFRRPAAALSLADELLHLEQ